LSGKSKILVIGEPSASVGALTPLLQSDQCDFVFAAPSLAALVDLQATDFVGVCQFSDLQGEEPGSGHLLCGQEVLQSMPDGVTLLDSDNNMIWANKRMKQWVQSDTIEGVNFYTAFRGPEILGPDFCPFHTAMATGECSSSTLHTCDDVYFQVNAVPLRDLEKSRKFLIVTMRDVTREVLQRQKLEAIHKAGIELSDLTPEEIFDMEVEDRIELVKSNIIQYTKDLLRFDVVEIRLLDQKTGELVPLVSEGMRDEASGRKLFSHPQGNGVTGFVAATGKSYLCENTVEDPLYIEGCDGAKSSLTVPLILHRDQVIGTFNVESPKTAAFSESDLQFVEIFSRDVAVALNTLELLSAQQANTAQASVEAIHGEVALPVDEILNDAVNVMERYIGHEPDVVERLQRILHNARDIKQVIYKVGQKMAPAEAVPESRERSAWPRLRDRRVLVVDADESVRSAAHALLERFGCIVETAHEGAEAIFMVRNSGPDAMYDAVISDIRLPDISGSNLFIHLQETLCHVPMILMSSFGYDPGHSLVKARQAGLLPNAILYKPFRLDQLLETVDYVIHTTGDVPQPK